MVHQEEEGAAAPPSCSSTLAFKCDPGGGVLELLLPRWVTWIEMYSVVFSFLKFFSPLPFALLPGRPLVYTVSLVLPIGYIIGLIFTLKTHSHIYDIHISDCHRKSFSDRKAPGRRDGVKNVFVCFVAMPPGDRKVLTH